jgi:two-component system, LuxR family, response regulator FixJ
MTLTAAELTERCAKGRVILIDDDRDVLDALRALLDLEGYACETHASATAYLEVLQYNRPSFPGPVCILCDVRMPGLDGLELQRQLAGHDAQPLVMMSGASGAAEAAQAFRGGAVNFLVKPIDATALLAAVEEALAMSATRQQQRAEAADVRRRIALLTARERVVAKRVVAGRTNQEIADELGIALRTVKLYRQRALEKLGASHLVDMVRIADLGGL